MMPSAAYTSRAALLTKYKYKQIYKYKYRCKYIMAAVQDSDNTDTWSREEVLSLLGRKSIHKWSKDLPREDMDAQSGS